MKRVLVMGLSLLMIFMIGCGAVSDAQTDLGHSKDFSENELRDAAKMVRKHFRAMYNGCTLLTIVYDGDQAANENLAYCNALEPDKDFVDCVVFSSRFETSERCDTTLEPNETYDDWRWYLAREEKGKWQLVMEGQG